MSTGLLLLRLLAGLVMFGRGVQRPFVLHGRRGRGTRLVLLAGLAEALSGMSLILGLLTPIGAAAIVGFMANAIVAVHWRRGFNGDGGWQLPGLAAAAAASLAFVGPGAFSVDHVAGLEMSGNLWGLFALAAGLVAASAATAIRERTLVAVVAEQVIDLRTPRTTSHTPAWEETQVVEGSGVLHPKTTVDR